MKKISWYNVLMYGTGAVVGYAYATAKITEDLKGNNNEIVTANLIGSSTKNKWLGVGAFIVAVVAVIAFYNGKIK